MDDHILFSRLRSSLPIFVALAASCLFLIVVAVLYLGRDIFVPLALAILLSFVLAPAVRILQRLRMPRGLAVPAVVLLAFVGIFAIGTVIVGQIGELTTELPRYQETMRDKIRGLRATTGEPGALNHVADMLRDLSAEIQGEDADGEPAGTLGPAGSRPIPVEVHEPATSPIAAIGAIAAPLVHPLATAGIVIIFAIFILLQREDLRNRFIRIAGTQDLQKTTAAIDDAAHRLSRLLLTQLALNTGFGAVIAVGLWLIGVPSPLLWGILSGILRFVPYVGAVISAALPLALSLAVDPGWSMFIWTALLFVVIEPLLGHVIEPLVYGHSTGLSPIAIVLAATLWTFLWGPIGLVLATPLTVCLVVIGRHTKRLQAIDILLGDKPALSPPEIFYQRMLAGDPIEAVEQAQDFLKERALSTYYDEVALEGLRLAHIDLGRGDLDDKREETIRSSVDTLVRRLQSKNDVVPKMTGTRSAEAAAAVEAAGPDPAVSRIVLRKNDLRPEWQRSDTPVLCIAGRGVLDEAAATMLGQLLGKHGLNARVLGTDALAAGALDSIDPAGIAMVCLSYMEAPSIVHIRYAVMQVRRRTPKGTHVLVGMWRNRDPSTIERLRRQTSADSFVTSLRDALAATIAAARRPDEPAAPARVADLTHG